MKNDKLGKKQDSFTAILRFMTKADIVLCAGDENILSRWIYCDVLLRTKKYNEDEIIDKIINHFKVSTYTARNDIYATQKLFAKTRLLQKKYLIAQHLERIDKDLEHVRKKMLYEKIKTADVEYDPVLDAKELVALAKLHEVYTYTLNSIPEEADKLPMQPPVFHFILPPGVELQKPMDTKSALEAADEYLKMDDDGIYKPEAE